MGNAACVGGGPKAPPPQTLQNTIKVLCLGTGGCGKTTFVKQMKVIHNVGWDDIELNNFVKIIRSNVVTGVQEAIEVANRQELQLSSKASAVVADVNEIRPRTATFDESLKEKLLAVYNDSSIQQIVQNQKEKLGISNLDYFFEHLDRICQQDYKPNDEDIVRCRQRTAGAYSSQLYFDKKYFEFHDLGGQRSERAKWSAITQQDNFLSVLFFIAVDEFDVPSLEEEQDDPTKIELAKSVFTTFVKNRTDKNCPVVLFLNRIDLLEHRLNIKENFKIFRQRFNYGGDNDINSALQFLEKYLTNEVDVEKEKITVHYTCALDREVIKIVWNAVRDGILRTSLAKVGI